MRRREIELCLRDREIDFDSKIIGDFNNTFLLPLSLFYTEGRNISYQRY